MSQGLLARIVAFLLSDSYSLNTTDPRNLPFQGPYLRRQVTEPLTFIILH